MTDNQQEQGKDVLTEEELAYITQFLAGRKDWHAKYQYKDEVLGMFEEIEVDRMLATIRHQQAQLAECETHVLDKATHDVKNPLMDCATAECQGHWLHEQLAERNRRIEELERQLASLHNKHAIVIADNARLDQLEQTVITWWECYGSK